MIRRSRVVLASMFIGAIPVAARAQDALQTDPEPQIIVNQELARSIKPPDAVSFLETIGQQRRVPTRYERPFLVDSCQYQERAMRSRHGPWRPYTEWRFLIARSPSFEQGQILFALIVGHSPGRAGAAQDIQDPVVAGLSFEDACEAYARSAPHADAEILQELEDVETGLTALGASFYQE